MSLKRAALLQKKRNYGTGGDAGESDINPGDYGGVDVGSSAGSGPGGMSPEVIQAGIDAAYSGVAPGAGSVSTGKPGEEVMAQAASQQARDIKSGLSWGDIVGPGAFATAKNIAGLMASDFQAANARNVPAGGFPEAPGTHNQHEIQGGGAESAKNPFGGTDTPAQTTPAAPVAPGSAGPRQYVWDPVTRQYTLANVGGGGNPMGYNQGQVFQMASGGAVGLAAGAPAQARFMRGGGTGLSDSIPVQMDDGGQGWLADGEFVIPADVVSGLGGGSSEAGAKLLYSMMERIRQQAHGHAKQVNPVNPQQVLPV